MSDQDHMASRIGGEDQRNSRVEGSNPVFVFGSNLAGRHGKGAALYARLHHGAIYGQGFGYQGNSYAIPTKDAQLRTLPLPKIKGWVDVFLAFADTTPGLTFRLTPIGCGLAGYDFAQIAPMFASAPPNVMLPDEFKAALRAATKGSA